MEKLLGRMLEQQARDNKAFQEMESVREDSVEELYWELPYSQVSKTKIVKQDGKVVLKRFINNKLYGVEFKDDIKLVDAMDWFEIEDYTFVRCTVRFYN